MDQPMLEPAAAPPPAYPMAGPPLPGALLAVGVILLVLGVLAALWGVLFLGLGAMVGSFQNANIAFDPNTNPQLRGVNMSAMFGAMQGFVLVLGVIILGVGIAHLAAGIGVLRRRGWARITGIVLASIGLLIDLLFLASAAASLGQVRTVTQNGTTYDLGPSLLVYGGIVAAFVVVYVLVLVVLIRRGRDFA